MKRAWEFVAVVLIGSFAIQWAVETIRPLVPFILGTAALIVVGVIVYRRLKQW